MEVKAVRTLLIGAAILSVVLWVTPQLRLALWPLTIFNTFIHEYCHGLVALLTGGHIERISIQPDGSGLTLTTGGWAVPITSAGYLGSTLIGAAIIALSRSAGAAKVILYGLFAVMLAGLILFVRDNVICWMAGLVWAGGLAVCAHRLKGQWVVFVAQFLGLQLVLTSFEAFGDLIEVSRTGNAMSDASILQGLTGVPALAWAWVWAGTALVFVLVALRLAWKEKSSKKAPAKSSPAPTA